MLSFPAASKAGFQLPEKGTPISEVPTPALIIELETLQSNIRRLMSEMRNKVHVRPHLKTAKSPVIAKMLLDAGACGICVAKTGEAEIMCEAGIGDVLVTSPVGHPTTALWLARLIKTHKNLKVVIDSEQTATLLADALSSIGSRAQVLIDINVGQNRTGVRPEKAPELAHFVWRLKELEVIGLQGYEGHLQHLPDYEKSEKGKQALQLLTDTANHLRQTHKIEMVTTGGTGTYQICANYPGVTEIQPGSFIFMDKQYRDALGDTSYKNALFVLTTVISKPDAETATIDGGWKTFSTECGMPSALDSSISYSPAGDEHGRLTGSAVPRLNIGDQVMFVPSHIDTTVANHEFYVVTKDNLVHDVWPIATRGRVQ
jgi:D-serine deaminase-like pyridoxal phosphate-dependent protein